MANLSLPAEITAALLGAPYVDYDAVVDPETDLSAELINNLCAVIAAVSQVLPMAIVQCDATGAIIWYRSVFGSGAGVQPTVTANGNGEYDVEWESSYSSLHPTPATKTVSLKAATATQNNTTTGAKDSTATLSSATKVDVRLGGEVDAPFTLIVWSA